MTGLFLICSAMFLGAFFAGMSCYKLNRRQLAWLNCFAAGLLLGTALGVIIPEGVRSIYEGARSAHEHDETLSDEKEHGDSHEHHEDSHQERLLGKPHSKRLGFT